MFRPFSYPFHNAMSDMNKTVPAEIAPRRMPFTMLRVTELDRTIAFYCNMLGMKELGRQTFPDVEFPVFMGYGDQNTEVNILSTELGKKHTLACIADPDGYRIKLMQAIQET